jgi:hypothetical protein
MLSGCARGLQLRSPFLQYFSTFTSTLLSSDSAFADRISQQFQFKFDQVYSLNLLVVVWEFTAHNSLFANLTRTRRGRHT